MALKSAIYAFFILLLQTGTVLAQALPGLIPYKGKNGWGYCDSDKVMKIKPQFASAQFFVNGKALVEVNDSLGASVCMIDERGDYIVPPAYHWTGGFSIARLNVRDSNGKWGLLDTNGNITIPFLYDVQGYFETKYGIWDRWFMIVSKNGKWGVVDTGNNVLLPFEYAGVSFPDESTKYWLVYRDSLYGLIDTNRTQILPIKYQAITLVYGEEFFIVTQDSQTGVVDRHGKIVVPLKYDEVHLAASRNTVRGFDIKKNGYWGWRDVKGKVVIEPGYESLLKVRNNYIVARTYIGESKSILLNRKGKVVIPPIYDNIIVYDDSLVVTQYIDSGNRYIPYSRVLHKRTLQPISDWREIEEYSPIQGPVCGGSGRRYSYQDPPYLDSSGQRIYEFWKDGTLWNVRKYIFNGYPNKRPYYSVSGNWKGQGMFALVDSNRNFITTPQSRYYIIGGNYHDNRLIVRTGSAFALTDTLFNLVVDPSPRQITDYFHWLNQTFAIADYKFFDPERDADIDAKQNCFRCNCTTILDSSGNILKGFESYCNARLYKKGYYPYSPPREVIGVADSLGKVGFLDINGHIQYPALSFKYSNIKFYEPNYFLCTDNYPSQILVDSLGSEYIPGKATENISRAQAYSPYLNEYKDIPSFYQVRFQSSKFPPIYMDKKGTVYADQEVLME